MNETLKVIKARRSIRRFKTEQIKEEELQAIIEAGLYAPSAMNRQPWHFTVIQKKSLIDQLSADFKNLAKTSDHRYARKVASKEGYHVFHHAPTVILVSGDKDNSYTAVDCAAATQNMLLAAESLGIGTCWVGFIAHLLNDPNHQGYLKELGIPEGCRQFHSIALGYKDDIEPKPAERKQGNVNYIR